MKFIQDDMSYIPYVRLTGFIEGDCFIGKAEMLPMVAPYKPDDAVKTDVEDA